MQTNKYLDVLKFVGKTFPPLLMSKKKTSQSRATMVGGVYIDWDYRCWFLLWTSTYIPFPVYVGKIIGAGF